MMEDIQITILIENTAYQTGLKTEHGLSYWIEHAGHKILFDTGQSDLFLHNAKTLGIDLSQADAIVLSHGHYDHTGGLPSVSKLAQKAKIYLHPSAVEPKYSHKTSGARYIGMSDAARQTIQGRQIKWTSEPVQIFPGISVTGQVPRLNDFEDVGGAFYIDEDSQKPDELLDDQSLFIKSSKGLVVIFGCAHSGVVNILDYISRLTDTRKIYAVIGGMHLLNASHHRITKTIEALEKYQVHQVFPLHCTGQKAVDAMKNALSDQCLLTGSGGQIII